MACHNRCDTTLACLAKLFQCRCEDAFLGYELSVYLVDDCSTDGTGNAVRFSYPDVQVIEGNGSLYWNQGMRLAWEEASNKTYDGYIWLNDDTMLYPAAISCMLRSLVAQECETGKKGIVVGSCRAPQAYAGKHVFSSNPKLTYGGRHIKGLIQPENRPIPISAFNGNLVLVSREAFAVLGNLSNAYRHSFGDIDYGLRAQKAGIPVWLAPGFLAECSRNPLPKWRNPDVSFWERWRAVRTPKGWNIPELKAFAQVRGKRWWILSLARQTLMVCFPRYAQWYQKKFSAND